MIRTLITGQYERTVDGRKVWYEYAYTAVRPDRPIPDNVIQLANQREAALKKQQLQTGKELPQNAAHGHTEPKRTQGARRQTARAPAEPEGLFQHDGALDHEKYPPHWWER